MTIVKTRDLSEIVRPDRTGTVRSDRVRQAAFAETGLSIDPKRTPATGSNRPVADVKSVPSQWPRQRLVSRSNTLQA